MAGHDRITPEGRRFLQQLDELKKLQVRIGFQADSGMAAERQPDGAIVESADVTLLDLAMWNELGTVNAPSRPFLRDSVDDNAPKITAFCKTQIKRLTQGATAQSVLEQIGVMQKGLIQEKIESGAFTANAASTIKKKGSDKPLIDTGRMRQSVNFVIKERGGE